MELIVKIDLGSFAFIEHPDSEFKYVFNQCARFGESVIFLDLTNEYDRVFKLKDTNGNSVGNATVRDI